MLFPGTVLLCQFLKFLSAAKGPSDLKQVLQVASALQHTRDPNVAKTLQKALAAFDNEQNGVVRVSELNHVSQRFPHPSFLLVYVLIYVLGLRSCKHWETR